MTIEIEDGAGIRECLLGNLKSSFLQEISIKNQPFLVDGFNHPL